MRATSQKRGKNGTRDRSNARRHPKTRAKNRPPRVFSTIAFILRVLLPRPRRHFLRAREREKIPRIKHAKKKERENRNAHQKRRTPARYLSRNYFPWLKTCSFVRSTRLKRERNVAGTNKISGGKRWWCLFCVCPVGVAKVGAFPFFTKKRHWRSSSPNSDVFRVIN